MNHNIKSQYPHMKFDYGNEEGLNQKVVHHFKTTEVFKISNYDRAVPATLAGLYALKNI